jgi:hypothetical protein
VRYGAVWMVILAACATGGKETAAAPAAAPSPYGAHPGPPGPPAPPAPAPSPLPTAPAPGVIRYQPGVARYAVHRRLRVEQHVGGQPQVQDFGTTIFLSASVAAPADSSGYPASFRVDSMVPDSGTPPPLADNMNRARALVFAGHLTPRGDFMNATPSDSAAAQAVAQLLGSLRDFLPRLPPGGLAPGATWTDTTEVAQQSGGSDVTRRTITTAAASPPREHGGAAAVRIEATQTYTITGRGANAGQPFELSGAGVGSGTGYVGLDGRYLGGEWRDSLVLSVRLPVQGVTVPVTQVVRTSVAVLP